MKVRAVVASAMCLLTLSVIAHAGEEKGSPGKEGAKLAAFERFKKLEGEWVGKETSGPNKGEELRVVYKVTSAGSAVLETMLPGTKMEMVTLIHPDGDDLVLTHYCALGNQPQMKADGKTAGNKVAFKFVRASNLKSDKAMHMHDATFTFVDDNTLRTEWSHYNDGKQMGTVVFELKRKK